MSETTNSSVTVEGASGDTRLGAQSLGVHQYT